MDNHITGTMLPRVTEPPNGNENGLKIYRAPESAEKTIISVNILVDELFPICFTSISLRQHYLDQVLRVDKNFVLSAELTQLPYAPIIKITILSI
jgi:hypothetical protein